jgi:ABC-type sugar transport system substrate-binding protein
MKGKITWVLGLALAVLATGSLGATGTKEPSKMVLGRVSFDLRHPYQQADAKWFETFAKEKGIDVITMDGKASAEAMTKATEDLIAKKVSGIVIQPADNANADAVAAEAHQAKIPLVTFVNEAFNAKAPHVELYEAETSMAMGKLAATKWKEWYPNKPMVIGVIDFPAIAQVHEQRALSFIKGVQSVDPSAKVAAILDGAGVRDKSMASAEDLIQSHPEANIIYGINADSALGALAAYEAAGRGRAKDGVPLTEIIVSTDGSEQEAVKIYDPNSALKITMALSPKNFAKAHLDLILKVINKEYAIDQAVNVKVGDVVLDYWSTPIEKFQDFLTNEYFSKVNLKELMQKK